MTRFPRNIFAIAIAIASANALVFAAPAVAQTPTQTSAQTQIPVQGQRTINFRGRGDAAHDIFIRNLLATNDYLLITRDTVITRNDTVRSKVLVVGATLRLDGTITGDLVSIGGNVFVRPSANVLGESHNIGGGFYPSQLAHLNPTIENEPNAPYMLVPTASAIDIVGMERPSSLGLPGMLGFSIPTYDRVNGLTLTVGAEIALPRSGLTEPLLRAWGTYYSQRGDFGGGAEFGITRLRTAFAIGAERTTITNERWIRSDVSNSLAMLLQGNDHRNYYAADRAYARLSRTLEKSVRTTTASLTAQVEEASPLRAGAPWSLFGADSIRPNDYGFVPCPAAGVCPDERVRRLPNGRVTSAIAMLDTKWSRPTVIAKMGGLAELGVTALGGDASFARFQLTGDVAMAGLRDHTLEVEWHAQGPMPGTDSLPYQRWSFVGGSGTLPTFQTAAFSGDRVVEVETKYTIPLPHAFILPLLGRPGIDLLHYAGMAWSKDQKRGFEQNVGIQLGYRVAYLRLVTDPRHFGDKWKTTLGVTLPRKSFPWETDAVETVK